MSDTIIPSEHELKAAKAIFKGKTAQEWHFEYQQRSADWQRQQQRAEAAEVRCIELHDETVLLSESLAASQAKVLVLKTAIKKALHKIELEISYGHMQSRVEYYECLKEIVNAN